MSKKKRVLIVDDREEWRRALVEALKSIDIDAQSAENTEKARQLLKIDLYHVLILDIRMDDGDTSNIEGLKLLYELHQHGLTDAIKVIMLSAFGTKEQMRTSFRDYDVADFIFKHKFNTREFQEDVQHVFRKNVCINLDMDIRWAPGNSLESAVLPLKLNLDNEKKTTRIVPHSILQKRIANELDDLLRRLFHWATSILVKPMSSGRSGTAVLEVRPFTARGSSGSVVVKYGSVHKIRQEYNNYKIYVEPLSRKHCTGIQVQGGMRCTPLLSGVIYSFLGPSDQLEDFGSFYRRNEPDRIISALDRLFQSTCGDWYANKSRLQLIDLAEDYARVLNSTPEKLDNALLQLRTIQGLDQDQLYFPTFQHWQPFKNPLHTGVGKSLPLSTYTGTTHGDFNQFNLLVDNEKHIWMIDFQGTGEGHILRDIVGLDSVIRFQLLTTRDVTFEERFAMEQALCSITRFSQVSHLTGRLATSNQALLKAYTIAVYLRTLAGQIVRLNPDDDFKEYYAALLYNALNTMRFTGLEQEQREHALLSACMLAKCLEMEVSG